METELREKIVVDGAEQAASRLQFLANAARNVAASFGGLQSILGTLGGIAGVFQVAQTIREVDQLYQSIGRVKEITGLAAGNAHALFNMFELSGIGAEGAERIITSMTRKSAQMEAQMGGVSRSTQRLQRIMRDAGVSVKDGPEARIFALSKAAKQGKIDINELTSAFGIPRGQAAQMMQMLRQGPEALKKIQKDAMGSAALIDDRALEAHKKMLQARRELGAAWGDLVNTLYKNLIPGITQVLRQIKQGFDDIQPVAEAIGKFLVKHMDMVVALTKTYLALLIAAKAANLVTGTQMGMFARGKQAFGAMAKPAAAAAGADSFAARAANPGAAMFATAGGPIVRILGTVAGRFGIIGAVLAVVAVAFEMLRRNVLGLRDVFSKSFGTIFDTLSSIGAKLVAVLGKLWDALKPIAAILAGTLLLVLLGLVKAIELVALVIDAVMTGLVALVNGVIWLINKIPGANIDYINMDDAKTKADQTVPETGKPPTTYQDFRGSKFEITNNFPPGIDGGRVAVAFGDELARLGERRLDSGLRPLYSYR